ncbi:MAG: lipase, partial [Oscillospiraceae bacterium]
MEKLNNYPVILVHGFSGFGEDEAITKLFPYYGMWNGNVNKIYKKLGTECYTPSIGAFSSAWDRACELYAHIVGGRVDYGKVHSEKNNHKRFGKTYKALVPNWGKLDGYGKIHKINLIGHSFGGPTVRLFIELL